MSLKKSDFTEKTIFVSVTRAQNNEIDNLDPHKTPLVDIARGTWRLNLNKANQCKWLMAVEKDEIIGVWEILGAKEDPNCSRWIQVVSLAQMRKAMPTRKWVSLGNEQRHFCEVKDVSTDIVEKFRFAKMSEIINGLGPMCGPVRYSF